MGGAGLAFLLSLALAQQPGPRLGNLDWGSTAGATGLERRVRDLVKRATDDLDAHRPVTAVSAIHLQGVLPSRPEYKESDEALKSLNLVLEWALCARLAEKATAARCLSAASTGARTWVKAYVSPSGDPIDESRLIPLIKSIDLIRALVTEDDRRDYKTWLKALVAAGDRRHDEAARRGGETATNNYETWRLAIRGLVSRTLGDPAENAATARMLQAQAATNIQDDGSTWDFHRRDALHYQVYDLDAYVEAALFVPELLGKAGLDRVNRALEFLRPFVTGEKQHVEFVGSKVSFDLERRAAGVPEFQNRPWDPKRARRLLRLARARFPALRTWTASLVDEQYDSLLKLLVALHGDGT